MEADLCIVMGTSLTVQPFASLPGFCEDHVPRVLINLERVGGLGSRADDVLLLGYCDTGVRKLASALGWEEELESLWNETKSDTQGDIADQALPLKSKDERLNDQIASLTDEVDRSLQITNDHNRSVRYQLNGEKQQNKMEPKQPRDAEQEKLLEVNNLVHNRIKDITCAPPGKPGIQLERSIAGNSERT